MNGRAIKKEWWSTHLKQLIHLGLVKISFNIYTFGYFTRASRSYSITDKGKTFLEKPHDLLVLSPGAFEYRKSKDGKTMRAYKPANRNKHYLPKIRELLLDSARWSEVKERGAYEYPGFQTEENYVAYCKDINRAVGFGSCQRPHFMWDDCQLTKRGTSTQKLNLQINTENTDVWVKRAFCEGVKVCSHEGCHYTVSNRQRKNKCKDHASSYRLKQTGDCPAQIIYVWPAADDGRRSTWNITQSRETDTSCHLTIC